MTEQRRRRVHPATEAAVLGSWERTPEQELALHLPLAPAIDDEWANDQNGPGIQGRSPSGWSSDYYGSGEELQPTRMAAAPDLTGPAALEQMVKNLGQRSGKLTAVCDAVARAYRYADKEAELSASVQGHESGAEASKLWYLALQTSRAETYARMLYWLTGDEWWNRRADEHLAQYSSLPLP